MRNNVNLVLKGDLTFYGLNPLGDEITIKPKKIEVTEYGCFKMTCKWIEDGSKFKMVLTPEEFQLLFGGFEGVINKKYTISFDIVCHDGEDPDAIINYIEKIA